MYMSKPRIEPIPSMLDRTTDINELWNLYEIEAKGVLSPNTLDTRRMAVREFIAVTGKTNVTEVNDDDLQKFKAEKLDQKCKRSTVKAYLSNVYSFFHSIGVEVKRPKVVVPKNREANIRGQIITEKEFKRLLEVTPSPMYRAIFSILRNEGPRVGKNSAKEGYPRRGLLGLNWGDVNFELGTVMFYGKGGEPYTIPLSELSERYLKKHKESGNRGKISPSDPVFVSTHGGRLSYEGFKYKLKKYMKWAEIPEEKRHAHAFRHTCGTRTTAKYTQKVAQKLLGQKKITTTEIYVHLKDLDFLMEKIRPDKVRDEEEEVKIKVCPECGYELLPDRAICVCGHDFTLHKCPECGRDVEQDANFCPYCSVRIGVPKPECTCGRELKPDYKICPNCGKSTEEVKKLWNERDLKKWRNVQSNMKTPKTEVFQKDGKLQNGELEKTKIKQTKVAARNLTNEDKAAKKLRSNNGSFCQSNKDCTARPNNKPYEVMLTSQKSRLVELLEEGWEPIGKTLDGEYILRRMNQMVT